MTKRRRWLNKMNQRVRTLVNKYGVDKDDILARLDKIDGVYITDSGQINVFKKFYNDKLEEVVEDLIPTYLTVKEEVFTKTAIKDFIGPLSKDQIHKSIQGYFAWSHEAGFLCVSRGYSNALAFASHSIAFSLRKQRLFLKHFFNMLTYIVFSA